MNFVEVNNIYILMYYLMLLQKISSGDFTLLLMALSIVALSNCSLFSLIKMFLRFNSFC